MASFDSSRTDGAPVSAFSIDAEVAVMKTMTVDKLQKKYAEECGEPARSRNKKWLIKRIAWRMQANREGSISERALARAKELASCAELRVRPPRESKSPPPAGAETVVVPCQISTDKRLPMPGSVLVRDYKGRRLIVTVLREGFELEGTVYKSLTAIAKAVTGKHWGGYNFFGLGGQGDAA
ncbi:MAG TPA: DUF2924 domain-containing protein [Pirellulaceae bacterium]|nr:DUF2924 domain-containing protein [Pirellulaceae bacterium]